MCWRTLLFCVAAGCVQAAERVELLAPLAALSLREPQDPPPPGGPFTYASTAPGAAWGVVNWSIPGGKLPPFTRTAEPSGDMLFSSVAAESTVQLRVPPQGAASLLLALDGAALPCSDAAGEPLESDLFASPNGANTAAPDVVGLPFEGRFALTGLAALQASVTLHFDAGAASPVKPCAVSQGDPLIAVVLDNHVAHQTLFYQLALGHACGPQPAARQAVCETILDRPAWFFVQQPFGVDETLLSYGQALARDGETRRMTVDLLPHLLALVGAAPDGMDRDASHWLVGTVYYGPHIWGNVVVSTQWSEVRLTAVAR